MVQMLNPRGRLSRYRTEAALAVSIALFLILILLGRSCTREDEEFAFVEKAEAHEPSPVADVGGDSTQAASVSNFEALCLDGCGWPAKPRATPAAAKKFVAPSDVAGLAESPISVAAALSAETSATLGQPTVSGGGLNLRTIPGGLSGFISIGLVPGPGGSGGGGPGGGGPSPGDGGGPGGPGGGGDPVILEPEDPTPPIETPLPGSIYLFGSALAGLAFAMRSRKK